ncbi:MAG: FtsX-like permease family protein, partial [Bacteroidota bacterium]
YNLEPLSEVYLHSPITTDLGKEGDFQNLPSSSHFQFDFGLAMASRDEAQQAVWVSHNFHTYFVLQEGADPKKLEAKFPQLMETYVGPQVKELLNFSMEEFAENGNRIKYNLEPLSEVYLHSPITTDLGKEGDFSNVILFGAIALFILLLACINFMNLSTARSANRAKEVGMRKVFGSLKGQLVIQFLMESVMLSLTAFLLAIAFAEAILPFFNQMADKSLQIPYTSAGFILAIVMGSGILGVLSGLYPAFYLSRFEPARVLKGKLATGASNSWIRKGLVVFQFATTIALLVSTFIVYQQMSFIQNKNLGFDKEQVVMIHDAWQLGDKVQTFKEELLSFPQVTHATASSYLPVSNTNRNNTVFWEEGKQDGESQILLQSWRVDHDYLSTLGMEIVQGRDFSIEMSTDSLGLILNEQAVRNFGLEEPLGARISTFDFLSSPQDPAIVTFTVIGVVKDFHFESLKEDITGLAFYIGRSTGYISARVNSSELGPTLAMMEEKWETFLPGQPFETSFLDERFSRMYAATIQQRDIFTAFATLAILVACLGLFALASFIAEQRQKEIGIRKVMGASISQIIILLNQDFAKLVIIALILAAAPTWYFMEQWLSNFQYRIDINVWVFLGAGLLALVIAIITVSSQSIRAAIMDPVDSIRDE